MTHKSFDLETILSITTGIRLTDMEKIHRSLNYLIGEEILSHQFPEAFQIASQYVFDSCPQLREVTLKDKQLLGEKQVEKFIAEQKTKYGESLLLSPMV